MSIEKLADAIKHLTDAVAQLQNEGPAGPGVTAAVFAARAALDEAKAPQADDAGGAV